MRTLTIEGVIGRKEDAVLAKAEKVFSYADLENFLAVNGTEPFEAVIKSPGGSVEEGFKIYDKLKTLDVTTIALTANSIASVIFLAGKVRKVTPTSQLIIHNAWVDAGDLSGEKLNFHTLKALTELFAQTDLKILGVYTDVAGQDKAAKLFALMAEDTNIDAQLALDLGFATEVLEEDYKALAFRNKVFTYSLNQLAVLGLQEGPLTTYADVVYMDDDGRVLLLQRKDSDAFEPSKWGFPGGKVMQGETTAEGAARELKEETGIEAAVVYEGEYVNEDESLTVYYFARGNEEPAALPEHQAHVWATLEDLESLPLIKDQLKRYRTIINPHVTVEQMKTEETEKKLNAFEKMLNGLKNLFTVQLKNMAAVTKEGVAIFIAGAEDGELVGKTVYLAEEGLPTEMLAPAGSHTLEDGTVVVIDDAGVITEVTPAAPVEDVEALKADFAAKTAAMEEEKKELQAKIDSQAKVIEESKKQVATLSEAFSKLKAQVTGDPEEKDKAVELSKEDFAKLKPSEKIRLRAMNRA